MGTLYVIGGAAYPEDLTLRARRTLGMVAFAFTQNKTLAQRLLAHNSGALSPALLSDPEEALAALRRGDGALILGDWKLGADAAAQLLVRRAAEEGIPVRAVPGPGQPIVALILSGLPADSFIYLGPLPSDPTSRQALLTAVAGEPRTLLAQGEPSLLPDTLTDLLSLLGNRPLAVMADGGVWRGTVDEAQGRTSDGPWILVIGGQREKIRWDSARLQEEIGVWLGRGQGVREISRRLADISGWPRREIYRRAVAMAQEKR